MLEQNIHISTKSGFHQSPFCLSIYYYFTISFQFSSLHLLSVCSVFDIFESERKLTTFQVHAKARCIPL